ncbi:ABC-F family ATP-binding cassette domain-containing protein [Terriglobus sp. RCC_193]|uniref:ABC-F family ATP-binding cassette domain-containing protein n=1 Tax=Terriglobus sp. RCC_193 TaxID=3239218 RepID=UPI0035255FBC
MISVSNVTMRYGSKILFEDVSTQFIAGRRYGLTGPNGAGKSTFMKVLTGELEAQKGTIVRPRKLGVLKQDQYAFDAYRVIDTVIMGNAPLWAALEERETLYNKAELTDDDGIRLGELEGVVGDENGYEAEADAAILLQGLDIPDEIHERKMSELQGGQKVRVLLAQALFGEPDALLLDEPTNYLDLESVHWLQDFLLAYRGTLITISHDRHFLNAVCTHIADIDYQTIITYNGGYDDMVMQKVSVRTRIESQNEEREKKIEQLNDFIARFSAGTRSSQVNSRKKEVERLATTELARSNIQRPFIRFDLLRPSGKHVLEVENVTHTYDTPAPDGTHGPVFKPFTSQLMRGEKVILMGRNGTGKTTLLKSLLSGMPDLQDNDFPRSAGEVKWGHEAQIGYFAQDHKAAIQHGTTVSEWLHGFDPKKSTEEIRGILGQMLFRGEEGLKKTEALSGGEAARLLFCKLMMQKPNILILDEPTNHLDLESINALNQSLQKYEGTVLLVTHDQDLIEEVGTRIWHFEHGQVTDHKGPYEEYQQQLAMNAK